MRSRKQIWLVVAIVTLFAARLLAADQIEINESGEGLVSLDGRRLFSVPKSPNFSSADERAEVIEQRLLRLAKNTAIPVEAIRPEETTTGTLIIAEDSLIMQISDADAALAKRERAELAGTYVQRIQVEIRRYREDWTWRNILIGTAKALGIAIAFTLLIWALWKFDRRLKAAAARWISRRLEHPQSRMGRYLPSRRLVSILFSGETVLRWALFLLLLQICIELILQCFPGTRPLATRISDFVWAPLAILWGNFIAYFPNLFFVAVVAILAYYAIRLINFAFREIQEERLTITGFYPDWAAPTSKLVRVLIFILVAIIIYPYLPGSNSAAFKGVSLFLGVLLSIGSSSAIASIVAGTILTYMRPFHVGDRVKVGDTTGDVVERSLLVTRIRTIKNVVVTIPNVTILTGQIFNYSTTAEQEGLILNTSVTIGYDAPWRQVHELLISAAQTTPYILEAPAPFVLQTALNDFYVAYEINAYTREANRMATIYSDLHQNIQDKFNEAGVEIMSPHYASLRDGNKIAIPDRYVPADYEMPGFNIGQNSNRKQSG